MADGGEHSRSKRADGGSERVIPFRPRIINPYRIDTALILAADESIRAGREALQAAMPWLQVEVLSHPGMLARLDPDRATVLIADDVALSMTDEAQARRQVPDLAIALLSFHRLIQSTPPSFSSVRFPHAAKADLVFAVDRDNCAPDRILPSVVRLAEDHVNIRKRPDLRRFIMLMVDDEPSWASHFLPILYPIIGQRVAVKITRTYEETLRFLFGTDREEEIESLGRARGYGDQVVCLLADIFFPKQGEVSGAAGPSLIRLVNRCFPRIPIIIASKAQEAAELAHLGYILPKGDPGSLETLGGYIRDRTGFGDLVVYDEKGEELQRVKDIHELHRLLACADEDEQGSERLRGILEIYGKKDKFSTWCYMHSLRELGDKIRPRKLTGTRMIRYLKKSIETEIERARRMPLAVEEKKIFSLPELLETLRTARPEAIQPLSDRDIISSWLDRRGYSELAEALRPIHAKGEVMTRALADLVEKWMVRYRAWGKLPDEAE